MSQIVGERQTSRLDLPYQTRKVDRGYAGRRREQAASESISSGRVTRTTAPHRRWPECSGPRRITLPRGTRHGCVDRL